MLALVVTSACSYSIAMPMTSSPLVPMQRTPIVDMKMWTYEECEAYGLDPRYVQDLEMRVDRLVQECEGMPDDASKMAAKFEKFPPVVNDLCSGVMESYGFVGADQIMPGIIQIQAHSAQDADMQKKSYILMQAFQGNFIDGDQEAEECD